MAKKSCAKSTAGTPRRRAGKQNSDAGKSESLRASASLRLKPSALLDTRVIYCGDNLEQLATLSERMQKEEGRMMKLARLPILHSSFRLLPLPYYHCDWHASHYVKVISDQIFGENNLKLNPSVNNLDQLCPFDQLILRVQDQNATQTQAALPPEAAEKIRR